MKDSNSHIEERLCNYIHHSYYSRPRKATTHVIGLSSCIQSGSRSVALFLIYCNIRQVFTEIPVVLENHNIECAYKYVIMVHNFSLHKYLLLRNQKELSHLRIDHNVHQISETYHSFIVQVLSDIFIF